VATYQALYDQQLGRISAMQAEPSHS
jgi:hypothetical protein